MTGNWAYHIKEKEQMAPKLMFLPERMPQLSITDLKVKWSLHFTFIYAQPVTQSYIQTKNTLLQSTQVYTTKNMDDSCAPTINY